MTRLLDDTQLAQWQRDGFIAVHDVLSPDEVRAYRDAIDGCVASRYHELPAMDDRDAYDRMFTQYYNLWEDSPEVRKLTFHPKLAELASELLAVPSVRVYCDQSFYKEPGSSETGVHQDYRLLCIEETATLNAWIPLESTTLAAGALGYLPGSHRFGATTNVDLFFGRNLVDKPEIQALLKRPTYLELPAGSVAFHHVLTFHLSTANTTERTRKAFAITYFADGSTRGSSWPHASVDRAAIAVGEPIRSAATPVAWPASERLPDPPPPLVDAPRGWPGRGPQEP